VDSHWGPPNHASGEPESHFLEDLPMAMRNLLVAGLFLAAAGSAVADVSPIAPFAGDLSDPLNYPGTTIVAEFEIFGGAASLNSFDGDTFIHLLFSSTLAGDPVTPRTGPLILGFTQGPGIFEFATPVRRFGSYFNNNSGSNDAVVEFFDADDNLIDTQIAATTAVGNIWTWNGWESDTPISSITVTGNGIADGFLWFDDLELSYVPEPGAGILLLLISPACARRRRRLHRL
jgi:hypothetical protein